MRITITIDASLYERALQMASPGMDESEIFGEAMKVFVRVQTAKRLAAIGGSNPAMVAIHRRRAQEPGPPR